MITRSPRSRYNRQDVEFLENILSQYRRTEEQYCPPVRIDYGSTAGGRPFTRHYSTETGPARNLPSTLLDAIINTQPGVRGSNNTIVRYDPINNVTVVTGSNNNIVSARQGLPRPGQF